MKNYLVIGLTGQTGAGKSTVCSFAEKEGAAVINADHIAREVMYPGSLCIQKLSEAFGKDIVDDKGCLIRSRLAERAFADREKTELLNRITHPFIIDKTKEYIAAFGNKNYEVVLFDAPQLFESGSDSLCDFVIAVTAPEYIRRKRIMERDNLDSDAAELRIHAQHEQAYYTEKADYVINGAETMENVRRSTLDALQIILSQKHINDRKTTAIVQKNIVL